MNRRLKEIKATTTEGKASFEGDMEVDGQEDRADVSLSSTSKSKRKNLAKTRKKSQKQGKTGTKGGEEYVVDRDFE
jgi:translation initiation factor 2 alpha subunit (eIF-2alpha)